MSRLHRKSLLRAIPVGMIIVILWVPINIILFQASGEKQPPLMVKPDPPPKPDPTPIDSLDIPKPDSVQIDTSKITTILFRDDFDDNFLDSNKWQLSGKAREIDGNLILGSSSGFVESRWIVIDEPNYPIYIEFRSKHKSRGFDPWLSSLVKIYFDNRYSWLVAQTWVRKNREREHMHFYAIGTEPSYEMSPRYYECDVASEWHTEQFILHPASGRIQFRCGSTESAFYNIGFSPVREPSRVKIYLKIRTNPDNYWYLDDFIVYQRSSKIYSNK